MPHTTGTDPEDEYQSCEETKMDNNLGQGKYSFDTLTFIFTYTHLTLDKSIRQDESKYVASQSNNKLNRTKQSTNSFEFKTGNDGDLACASEKPSNCSSSVASQTKKNSTTDVMREGKSDKL